MKRKNIVTIIMASALTGALAGCASTSEMDSLRAEVRQANETAQSAAATAEAARKEAAAASADAAEAKAMAQDAKATAMETDSKIDRMFKKAMYK
jgi:murein lipoprotein